MRIEIEQYNLPDSSLFNGEQSTNSYMVWNPDFLCVVLGFSNEIEKSIYIENIKKDNIPVYKRPSGGETVLLSSNTLVVSVVTFREKLQSVKKFFQNYNEKIIRALKSVGIKNLCQNGISDISIGDKKIIGSAIYQNKEKVFYHAVLNVNESSALIEKYLKHPLKEPEYRQGRKHKDFITSLVKRGYNFDVKEIKKAVQKEFSNDQH